MRIRLCIILFAYIII
ncbi:hypothetical protein SAMN02982990_01406 [Photorhabdus luminescens]|uniref:Uncharacterized protein n=1 Tax=Photorhabdus luminescens TaxID=29488 RepID=A0A1G5QDD2_PHOLU|nr:hypothetical protein SAMN02982990_01406 [Photorhabdus luminescens]